VTWIPGAVLLLVIAVLILRSFLRGLPDTHKAGDSGSAGAGSLGR
jgi:hypothetical protein